VFGIFSAIAHPDDFDPATYLPYARGADLTKRMPLFVRPREKLSHTAVHALMSNHYEQTWLDPSKDVGAGAEHSPYRWNGLTWTSDGKSYVNERVVGVHYTGTCISHAPRTHLARTSHAPRTHLARTSHAPDSRASGCTVTRT
jgi:hypothetical protein